MDPSADTDGERLKVKASLYYSEAKERMTKLGKTGKLKTEYENLRQGTMNLEHGEMQQVIHS